MKGGLAQVRPMPNRKLLKEDEMIVYFTATKYDCDGLMDLSSQVYPLGQSAQHTRFLVVDHPTAELLRGSPNHLGVVPGSGPLG